MRKLILTSFVTTGVLVGLFAAASAWSAGGGPAPGGSVNMPERQRTPQEIARDSYNSGIKYLKDAKEYDDDAHKATDPKKVAKATEKATKAYQKALKEFVNAVAKVPTMYEAWNYVGFTERHLGDYKTSLDAYAKALELKPNYPEAIEYRGEAFLGLNALDDAKQAYLSLYRISRPLSQQLLDAMKTWVEKRKQDAQGVDSTTLDGFASWINERAAMAAQSASNIETPPARW
ncbi:MAG TPA: tetratricopeptide repeat protein [Steroidobacteraceae bacterium]|nr:tetratricopeptide repeat protein [Steroidobacteraceae bacterium]